MRFRFYSLRWQLLLVTFLLTFSVAQSQTYIVGAASAAGNTGTTYPAAFPGWFGGNRQQYLYTAAQISSSGLPAGSSILKIAYNVLNVNACPTLNQYSIKMKLTSSTSVTGTETGLIQVKNPFSVTPVMGWNEITLDNSFTWDGTSNVLIEICFNNGNTGPGNGNATTEWFTSVGYTSNIRFNQDNSTDACTPAMTLTTTNLPRIRFEAASAPCAGPIAGGTATATVSSVCPSVNFAINVAGSSTGIGISYQWQSSTDGGFTWNDISGSTSSTFSGTQTAAHDYRRRMICNAGPDTAYSSVASVGINPFTSCYCTTSYPSNVEPITLVQFATINNATSGTVNGTPAQEDFTSISANVIQNESYNITVNGNTVGNFTNYIAVFIDWNQNGLFTDAGETYQLGTILNCTNCGVSSSITIPTTALTGPTLMRVTKKFNAYATACNTTGFGQTEDYTVNVLPPPANEVGVLAITKPGLGACNLNGGIWVNLQNLGTDTLESAVFNVSVGAVSLVNLPAVNWTGSVPPQSVLEVQVPVNYALADGDSVRVVVSQPNGVAEDPLFTFNNTVARRVFVALTGNKTVAGTGANYANVNAALTDLYKRGVCDTVYFKIAPGAYATQHTFLGYPGAGVGKLAVFESASGVASDVTYSFAGTSTANNFVFKFDGANGYQIKNLTLVNNTSATYSNSVAFSNVNRRIALVGNTLMNDTTSAYPAVATADRISIYAPTSSSLSDINIEGNNIIGADRSINLEGPATFNANIKLVDNHFNRFSAYATYLSNAADPVLTGNILSPRASVGHAFGLVLVNNINSGLVAGNDVRYSSRYGTGVYLSNAKNVVVSNNFIYLGDTTTSVSRGVQVENLNSADIAIVNNSIAYNSTNTTAGAINLVDGTNISLYNNNVGAFRSAPAARIEKSYSVTASNNNNIFGTNLAYVVGTIHTTLAALQAATGFEGNSVSVNPGFNGTDLHTCAPALNAAGMSLASVTVDFDGDTRSNTPDIGADEFFGDASGLLAQDAFTKCPAQQVTLGNTAVNGVSYSWTPAGSGTGSQISVTNAGTYVVTGTSSCGSFSDTAVVTNNPLPTASYTSISVGLAVIFTNTSTNGNSYLWDFGDGSSSTDENPTHVYSSAGTYSVKLTVTNSCGSAEYGPFPVNVINASIEEANTVNASLFPNPTNGQFTVSMSNVSSTVTTVSVIDLTGKVIEVKNIPAGTNQITLDATSFASGVYSVKISNGEFTKVIRLVRK